MGMPLVIPGAQAQASTFQRWWEAQGEWVEEPNQRRDGESGVKRLRLADPQRPLLYCKRQTGHLYRSLAHPFGRPTALREYQALRALERLGIRVPRVVYCAAQRPAGQWQALLVTEELSGFVSLEQWYQEARHLRDAAVQARLLQRLGEMLARLHRAGWQHGCLYPKHIFLRVDGEGADAEVEVALLDLEKCRRRLWPRQASRRDMDQLRRRAPAISTADWAVLQAHYQAALLGAQEVDDGH